VDSRNSLSDNLQLSFQASEVEAGAAFTNRGALPNRTLTRLSHESLLPEQRSVTGVNCVIANRFRALDGNVVDEHAFARRLNRFMQQPLT